MQINRDPSPLPTAECKNRGAAIELDYGIRKKILIFADELKFFLLPPQENKTNSKVKNKSLQKIRTQQ